MAVLHRQAQLRRMYSFSISSMSLDAAEVSSSESTHVSLEPCCRYSCTEQLPLLTHSTIVCELMFSPFHAEESKGQKIKGFVLQPHTKYRTELKQNSGLLTPCALGTAAYLHRILPWMFACSNMALGTPSRDFCQKNIGNLKNKMLCLAQGIVEMFSTVTQDMSNLFTFAQGIHCGHSILTSLSKNNTLSSYSMGIKKPLGSITEKTDFSTRNLQV